jgi:hypothetical protein
MEKQTHTPGPWQIAAPKGNGTAHMIWRNDEGPDSAAETNTNHKIIARDVHNAGDARLIAAAPDLLAALKGLYETGAPDGLALTADEIQARFDAARAALAKTEGR